MTVPRETLFALSRGERILSKIARGEYKRVPKELQADVIRVLRHYPGHKLSEIYRMIREGTNLSLDEWLKVNGLDYDDELMGQ